MNNVAELVGYTVDDMALALNAVEDSLPIGGKATLMICSSSMPTEQELMSMFYDATLHGFHLEYPKSGMDGNISVTQITLEKGSPQWQLLIPLIPTVLIVGLIAFGITKIETIAGAIVKVLIVTGVVAIVLAIALRRPAEKYIERGGKVPLLPATRKKALATS